MPHIAVLVHAGHELPGTSLLATIAAIWRESGIRISVLNGPQECADADVLVMHVNRTVVPAEYLHFAERFPVVINGGAVDISKRRVSRNLVTRADDVPGPVVVKTDRNYGGKPEYKAARKRGLTRGLGHVLRNCLPWSMRSSLAHYPVFPSLADVPRAVWYNRHLVVERFLAERSDGFYCLRTWLFLGNQERMAIFRSREPIVKGHNIVDREQLFDVPADLREMRRELGFDFGKFDFAVVDGRTVLYDANRTPALRATNTDDALPWLRQLASGIELFLPRAIA